MRIKKGDWIKARRRIYFGCNKIDCFYIVKVESLAGSLIGAKCFIKNEYGGYIPKYVYLSQEDESFCFSVTRKAYSNEIFSSLTDFKVSQ